MLKAILILMTILALIAIESVEVKAQYKKNGITAAVTWLAALSLGNWGITYLASWVLGFDFMKLNSVADFAFQIIALISLALGMPKTIALQSQNNRDTKVISPTETTLIVILYISSVYLTAYFIISSLIG